METQVFPSTLSDMSRIPFETELSANITYALTVLRGRAEPKLVMDIVRGLKPFPQDIALKVSKEAVLKLERYAAPHDFVELACKYHGVSKDKLLAQGRVVFYELFNLRDPQYDLICSNWRVVYAVKHEFGTLQNFFSTVGCEQPCWKQKRFAESFASVDFTEEAEVPKEYFLEGFATYQELTPEGKRPINFLGSYQQCKFILQQLGFNETHQLPPVPKHNIVLALPAKTEEQKPVVKPKVDPQQRKIFSEMLAVMRKKRAEQRSDSGYI